MLDNLIGNNNVSYTDAYSSLGSLYVSLDEGAIVKVIGDYGNEIKSAQLKKGESVLLTLEGKVALDISNGSCRLDKN